MTNTLAALTGVPSLKRPDGANIYVERLRADRRTTAELAKCEICAYLMSDGPTFALEESIRLHETQTGHKRISLWRYL